MSVVVPRHVMVVASQHEDSPLRSLEEAARDLMAVLLDPDIGACQPGLPGDDDSLLYGELAAADIEARVRLAIDHAAAQGATLVLALLGHGTTPGADQALYLMARQSLEGSRSHAVDVRRLLVEAAEKSGINGVIGIIDTCTAGAAQPVLQGHARLSLLMASGVDQAAYDMDMSRQLAGLLRAGVPRAAEQLRPSDLARPLQDLLLDQDLVCIDYDGDMLSEPLWLACNRRAAAPASYSGSYGMTELAAEMRVLRPDRPIPDVMDRPALGELLEGVRGEDRSPERERVARMIENLIVARQTISFLQSVDTPGLTTEALRRALRKSDNTDGASLADIMEAEHITEVDAAEHVALNWISEEKTCRPRMARFVLALADDLRLNPHGDEMRIWAGSVQAIVAFSTALKDMEKWQASQRFQLIISLQHTVANLWPSELSYWFRDEPSKPKIVTCEPSQKGVSNAVAEAVREAARRARRDKVSLERIDIAAPAGILLKWHPEEVMYGGEPLGRYHTVLPRWSGRLADDDKTFEMNDIALKRLEEILRPRQEGSRLRWLTARQVADLDPLDNRLSRHGNYPAIGLLHHPGDNAELMDWLLEYTPVLLWPQAEGSNLGSAHCQRVSTCWHGLPGTFLAAYRARWTGGDADLVADIRAVWDDKDWLDFCIDFHP